jgi:tryptophan synthase alpha chain
MSNMIDDRISHIRSAGRTGIMTHVVVGYPSLAVTEDIVRAMAEHGVDFVELQIPFSDPLADGPTIQAACETALAAGIRVRDSFTLASRLRDVGIPLLFMAYFNTVFTYGVEAFCQDAAEAGISGLIVPDAPLEAAIREDFLGSCRRAGLYNIMTFSPASTAERIRKNAEYVQGFVYCMARQGITGAGGQHYRDLATYVETVRANLSVPVALGFGISDRARVDSVAPYCDIAVVGSAVIDIITRSDPARAASEVGEFVSSLTGRPTLSASQPAG